jgi:AcrR family transcriptional regulator
MTPADQPRAADTSPVSGRRGRPRDPQRSQAIVDAARELLREGGWEALTIEAVAARAQVGRPTVYRRWPTKGHLATAILGAEMADMAAMLPVEVELPDTGSLTGDLTVLARALRGLLGALASRGLHPGVISEIVLDAELARQFRDELSIPDRDRVAEVVRRAIERGEVRPDVDPGFVIDALSALVVYFLFIVHEPVGDRELARIVDLVTRGCLVDRSG